MKINLSMSLPDVTKFFLVCLTFASQSIHTRNEPFSGNNNGHHQSEIFKKEEIMPEEFFARSMKERTQLFSSIGQTDTAVFLYKSGLKII